MDGWQTLSALRKIEPTIPVILISGYDHAQFMGNGHSDIPHTFLSKPYKSTTLRDAIYKALKKHDDECFDICNN